MMTRVVIDTNVLVGLLDRGDHWHNAAVSIREALKEACAEIIYLDCVLTEVISILARRTFEQRRREQFDTLLNQLLNLIPDRDIIWVTGEIQRLYQPVVELVRRSGGELNFHDALIATYCREQNISILVSFDRDFDQLEWLTRVNSATEVSEVLRPEKE